MAATTPTLAQARADWRSDEKHMTKAASAPKTTMMIPAMVLLEAERMASQGMTIEQIGAAMGYPGDVWGAMLYHSSDIADAVRRGKARGIDMATSSMLRAVVSGDGAMTKFMLERLAPQFAKQDGPAVVIQTGNPVQIDAGRLQERIREQQKLIEGVAEPSEDPPA